MNGYCKLSKFAVRCPLRQAATIQELLCGVPYGRQAATIQELLAFQKGSRNYASVKIAY